MILIVYACGLNEGSRLQNLTFFTDLEIYGRSREEFGQSVWGFRTRGLTLCFTIFYTMKKTILLVMAMMCGLCVCGQNVTEFVSRQVSTYPESRLLDLYKSCFQDYMGAEHLIADTASTRQYLRHELATTSLDELLPWRYEPCGPGGNHVRVSLRCVLEGLISEDALFDAFVRSATGGQDVNEWRARWNEMAATIDTMGLALKDYDSDRRFIDSILAQGKYAISHSPEYREAYHPHYRIVARDIFEAELLPLLEP